MPPESRALTHIAELLRAPVRIAQESDWYRILDDDWTDEKFAWGAEHLALTREIRPALLKEPIN